MIHATRNDYERAFQKVLSHPGVSNGRHSTYMIHFYRVECGLKTLLCDRRRASASSATDALLLTHNLAEIVRELRIPAQAIGKNITTFRLQRERGPLQNWPNYSIMEAHTVWRYGVEMHAADESELVQWLNRLVTYIETQL
jgi:hypothetical protein